MNSTSTDASVQEAKHKIVNGKLVIVEYREHRSTEGDVMVRYSARIDGEPCPLELEMPKEILQAIQEKFDRDIYHIIPDSIIERVRKRTSALSTGVQTFKMATGNVNVRYG